MVAGTLLKARPLLVLSQRLSVTVVQDQGSQAHQETETHPLPTE